MAFACPNRCGETLTAHPRVPDALHCPLCAWSFTLEYVATHQPTPAAARPLSAERVITLDDLQNAYARGAREMAELRQLPPLSDDMVLRTCDAFVKLWCLDLQHRPTD